MPATSKFFAYTSRLRWIKRWGLKRNIVEENVMEHSWQVATIAHALALIHNEEFNGNINVFQVASTALYHDASEIITGDLPAPVKYHSTTIQLAYKEVEAKAEQELLDLIPIKLQKHYRNILLHELIPAEITRFIKAADTISAFLKCQMEMQAGNNEFKTALQDLEHRIRSLNMPEVDYFMGTFSDSFLMTLDELLIQHDKDYNTRK